MQLIGQKRGAIVQGGMVDDEKVARIILEDFRNCKFRKNKFGGALKWILLKEKKQKKR